MLTTELNELVCCQSNEYLSFFLLFFIFMMIFHDITRVDTYTFDEYFMNEKICLTSVLV